MNSAPYNALPTSLTAHKNELVEAAVLIDNIAKHPTPEGLLLSLVPAGLMPRLWAWLIDLLIRGIIIAVIGVVSLFLDTAGIGIMAITYFLITWLYPVYFEVYRRGMTPGKKQQGIYVCHDDGTPISLPSSMIRNLLRVADFLPIGFAAGILTVMFTSRSQRIGDLVAGTLVVYRQQDDLAKLYKSMYGFAIQHPISDSEPVGAQQAIYDPASALFFYPLRLKEQQALVSYVERLGLLSLARQQEIAYTLAPLVKTPMHTVQGKNAAVQQAVIQKAMMIQGQAVMTDTGTRGTSVVTDSITAQPYSNSQQDNQR